MKHILENYLPELILLMAFLLMCLACDRQIPEPQEIDTSHPTSVPTPGLEESEDAPDL